jgi:hypothetical protein
MTLLEAISAIDSLNEDDTIYAAEPWVGMSQVIISADPQGLSFGFKYFLEVFVAREFLEGWLGNFTSEPNLADKCSRLIAYATNDA